MLRSFLPRVLFAFVVVVSLAAIWQFTTGELQGAAALAFPSPAALLVVFETHWWTLAQAAGLTCFRVLLGVALGGTFGLLFALLCRRYPLLFALFNPIVEIIRPIPPIALTPFFIFWFGLGTTGQILLIGLGSFMVIFVATTGAIANLDPIYERALFLLGGNKNDLPFRVWLPASLPEVATALRVTLATAFALTIAAEYLGAQGGLGFIIRNARTTLDTPSILAAALLLGVVSYLIDLAVRNLMLRLTDWVPRASLSDVANAA